MLWLVLPFILLLLLYLFMIDSLSYWEKRNVRSEKPLPLLGNMLHVALGREDFWSMLERMYKNFDEKYPYFGIYLLHKPILIITDRDMIKKVLIKDFTSFVNRTNHDNKNVDSLITNTLFVLKNEFWRNTRRKLGPIMSTGKMKGILPLMAEIADGMEAILETRNGKNVNVKELIKKFSVDVTAECFFGMQCETLKYRNKEFKTLTDALLDHKLIFRRIATFCWALFPMFADIFRLPFFDTESSENMKDIYCFTEKDREMRNIKRNDLMNLMLELSKQETHHPFFKFDDVRRSAQALQFFSTGTEATAYTGSLCLYELSFNPMIQQKLRDEIKEHLDPDGNISYDALYKMKYLDLVIKESLRKHPFLPFITRYAEEDYVIESTGLKVENRNTNYCSNSSNSQRPQIFSRTRNV